MARIDYTKLYEAMETAKENRQYDKNYSANRSYLDESNRVMLPSDTKCKAQAISDEYIESCKKRESTEDSDGTAHGKKSKIICTGKDFTIEVKWAKINIPGKMIQMNKAGAMHFTVVYNDRRVDTWMSMDKLINHVSNNIDVHGKGKVASTSAHVIWHDTDGEEHPACTVIKTRTLRYKTVK